METWESVGVTMGVLVEVCRMRESGLMKAVRTVQEPNRKSDQTANPRNPGNRRLEVKKRLGVSFFEIGILDFFPSFLRVCLPLTICLV